MSDIEASVRVAAMDALRPWFFVFKEARVTLTSGHTGFLDIMASPRDARFSAFTFAIEVKANRAMVGCGLAKWFKQAIDYVGAKPADALPQVTSSFLWMVDLPEPEGDGRLRLRSMMDLAHQFRTGIARSGPSGFVLQLGPDEVFRSRGWRDHPNDPWPGRALERLTSGRQSAGTRRRPSP